MTETNQFSFDYLSCCADSRCTSGSLFFNNKKCGWPIFVLWLSAFGNQKCVFSDCLRLCKKSGSVVILISFEPQRKTFSEGIRTHDRTILFDVQRISSWPLISSEDKQRLKFECGHHRQLIRPSPGRWHWAPIATSADRFIQRKTRVRISWEK